MSDPKHPVWALLNLIVVLSFLFLCLSWNATNFDFTEIKSIAEVGAMMGVWEVTKRRIGYDKKP